MVRKVSLSDIGNAGRRCSTVVSVPLSLGYRSEKDQPLCSEQCWQQNDLRRQLQRMVVVVEASWSYIVAGRGGIGERCSSRDTGKDREQINKLEGQKETMKKRSYVKEIEKEKRFKKGIGGGTEEEGREGKGRHTRWGTPTFNLQTQ